jgi:hypothetical protein
MKKVKLFEDYYLVEKKITLDWDDNEQAIKFSDGEVASVDYDGDFKYRGELFSTHDHTGPEDLIKDLEQRFKKDKFKWVGESINEGFYGPFVFSDKTDTEKLKEIYNDAVNGYANWQKGFEYPKSDYKKAYQEAEKILKKRGVKANESFNEAKVEDLTSEEVAAKWKVGTKIKWTSPDGVLDDIVQGYDGIQVKINSGGTIPYKSIVESRSTDVMYVIKDIREYNKTKKTPGDFNKMVTSIIKNLGFDDTDDNFERIADHLGNSMDEDDNIPEDKDLVNELFGLLESKYNGNIAGDAAEYIAKELSQYVKGIINQSNDNVTYFHLKDKSKKDLVIKMLMDLYSIEAQDGGNQFSPSPTIKFDNNQIVESISVNESKTLDRDEMMAHLDAKYGFRARTTEEFNNNSGGIWVSGEGSPSLGGKKIYNYYANTKGYEFGVLNRYEEAINKLGWYSEWYDAGTVMIWPL